MSKKVEPQKKYVPLEKIMFEPELIMLDLKVFFLQWYVRTLTYKILKNRVT